MENEQDKYQWCRDLLDNIKKYPNGIFYKGCYIIPNDFLNHNEIWTTRILGDWKIDDK